MGLFIYLFLLHTQGNKLMTVIAYIPPVIHIG